MFKHLLKNQLIKVLSFNSISVILNFVSGFVYIKFVAHFLGAEGMAILGNFKNFATSVKTFSTLGFNHGITKLIAEHRSDSVKLSEIITTSFLSRLLFSLFISALLILLSNPINNYVFHNVSFQNIIYLLAILLPFYSINTFILAVLNGFKKFEKLITINICSTITAVIISVLLIWKYQLSGALIGIATVESLVIIIHLLLLRKTDIPFHIKKVYFSIKTSKVLLNFSFMALVSALVIPNSHMYLRNLIIASEGIQQAGYWEALNNFSNYYMLIVSSGLTLYYLPKLSETKNSSEFLKELSIYYKYFVPAFLIGILFTYFFRNELIVLFLNKKFLSISDLFIWQLIGDTFKVLSLAFGYYILAKTMTKKYLFIEIFFYGTYLLLSKYFIESYHTKGVVMSYAFANMINFFAILFLFKNLLLKQEKQTI